MLTTTKSRLAVVASVAWLFGAYILSPKSVYLFTAKDYIAGLLVGWAAIWLAIYGAYWIIEAPREPLKLPSLPRWAAYILIGVLVILIMGLPKALMH